MSLISSIKTNEQPNIRLESVLADAFAVLEELCPNGGDFFSGLNSRHGDRAAVGCANRDPAQLRLPLARHLIGYNHRELS